MTYIGRQIRRIEDRPLLVGDTQFVADMSLPNQLHMRVVRSQIAHGRLLNVDVSEALTVSGVIAAWSASDVAGIPPIDFRMTRVPGLEHYRQPILAARMVRYVGEPVAVVFADDQYVAEDAAELVAVEIDEVEPITDATVEPGLFDDEHSTEAALIKKGRGNIDDAFATADVTIDLELSVGRQSGIPMECRGALAHHDPMTDLLEVFGAAKVPHQNRDAIAAMLSIPRQQVILHEGHVGGGFGIRGELYPEDVLVCLGAYRLRQPVKWIEDRREHLMAANHSRDQVHHIRAAVDSDGWIRGVVDEFWLSQGAYVRTHAATVPDLTAALLPGPYVWPAYRVTGHIRLTNKTPAGTYRAPGRFEGTFVRERLIDVVAERLRLDPVAVRRRNLIKPGDMPFDRGIDALGTRVQYDSGDYPALLDHLLDHIDYRQLVEDLKMRRAEGEMVGIGLGYFVEKSGLGPFDGVRVMVDEEGAVLVVTGAASMGQGVETTVAQICAEALGVEFGSVRVRHGHTDEIPFGMGAFASRVTVMTGSATHIAAGKVRDIALETAATMLEAHKDDLTIDNGSIHVRGSGNEPSVTLGQVATALSPSSTSAQHGLSSEGWFHSDQMTYPFGVHAAVVRLDPGTANVAIERYIIAYDVGRAVNPMLVEGQLRGGAAQGLGGALLEEFAYDDHGQPLATSFMDYLLPTSLEMPPVEVLLSEDSPSPLNPLGVKGAGEGGITGAGAAIGNAIANALQSATAVTSIPMSPDRLRALLSQI